MNFFTGNAYIPNGFIANIRNFSAYNNHKTGYANLDAVQPLYPGFYVLGAISSLGKTTFAHQMSDQIATSGTPVLYFSLEQSALELYSKSISRQIYKHSKSDPSYTTYSAMQIRRGEALGSKELTEQMDAYVTQVQDNMVIIECNFAVTVEMILETIASYINTTHKIPVIFIDYLQIISPSSIGNKLLDGRAAIDHAVHTLKSFQSVNRLTIFAICSLNRQNYLSPIDFEAFKESGGIEYTADCVWGLQLQCIHDEVFGKEGKLKDKREAIQKAKSAIPREIELVVLKNRYGKTNYSCDFTYNPVFDFFEPASTGNASQSLDDYWSSASSTPFE